MRSSLMPDLRSHRDGPAGGMSNGVTLALSRWYCTADGTFVHVASESLEQCGQVAHLDGSLWFTH